MSENWNDKIAFANTGVTIMEDDVLGRLDRKDNLLTYKLKPIYDYIKNYYKNDHAFYMSTCFKSKGSYGVSPTMFKHLKSIGFIE